MFACSLVGSALGQNPQSFEYEYRPAPVDNPLKGLVPYQHPAQGRFPHSMEFNYLPLSKLLVGERKYDFSPLEKMLNDIKSRNNQSVVRVFVEYPGKSGCIPEYLLERGLHVERYKKTGNEPFEDAIIETPDYENKDLRRALQDFIAEFGRRYDGDPRIGYITAGLLGAWGEWHTYPRSELFASKKVQSEVMDAYAAAFRKTPVLLRYPAGDDDYAYAKTSDRPFGYHDDSFAFATLDTGKEDDDWFFVPKLKAAKSLKVWQKYPIGGEIRPEVWGCCFDPDPCTRPDQQFGECRDLTHVTWLMDTGMVSKPASAARKENALREVRKMGYEFYVTSMKTEGKQVVLNIKNTGIAPFYHDGWKVQLGVVGDDDNSPRVIPTDWELTKIQPGQSREFAHELPVDSASRRVFLRVPNRMDGGRPLRFANKSQDADYEGWMSLHGK
ncbi:MAG: hypothetical protein AAF497_07620 [Planctomycetota bacterium]